MFEHMFMPLSKHADEGFGAVGRSFKAAAQANLGELAAQTILPSAVFNSAFAGTWINATYGLQ